MDPETLAKTGSETGHQRAFMQVLFTWSSEVHAHTFAIPNGGARGDSARVRAIRGGDMKAGGVKAGVPDIMIAWPNGGWAGLFLELKKPGKGVVGPDQKVWRARLEDRGYAVRTVYGYKEAINAVAEYFGQKLVCTDACSGW